MINLETPKKQAGLIDQAHQLAMNMLRPISRKYDRAEHDYPHELDMLAALIDGVSETGAVGDRVALGAGGGVGAGGEDGLAHGREVTEPLGVRGAVVVVVGGVALGPGEQAGADGRDVVGPGQCAGPSADGGEHVEVPALVHLEQAAAHEVARELGGLGGGPVEHVGEHAQADREVEQADAAQRGGARRVEQAVRGVDGLVEADGGHRVAEPDQRRLHGHLLDEKRQPAGGAQQAAYLVGLRGEVDERPTCRPDAAQEQLDGRTLQRCPMVGHGQRPHAYDGLVRLAGGGAGGHDDAYVGGALEHRLDGRTGAGGVEVEAVEDEQAVASVERAAEGAGQRVTRSGLGAEARQGGEEHLVEAVQGAGVHPRDPQSLCGVAHEQGLAAARRTDHGHPARLLEGAVQRTPDVLATETGGQHGSNLSSRADRDR